MHCSEYVFPVGERNSDGLIFSEATDSHAEKTGVHQEAIGQDSAATGGAKYLTVSTVNSDWLVCGWYGQTAAEEGNYATEFGANILVSNPLFAHRVICFGKLGGYNGRCIHVINREHCES
jgi:hypothetical protein